MKSSPGLGALGGVLPRSRVFLNIALFQVVCPGPGYFCHAIRAAITEESSVLVWAPPGS